MIKYEFGDGTETYDASLPHTTSCPSLPGQPVNILDVPEERNPSHERSSSLNMLSGMPQTLRPEDKFLQPKAVPSSKLLSRLHTSPPKVQSNQSMASAQSTSPKGKLPWLARNFWGLKSASGCTEGFVDWRRAQTPDSMSESPRADGSEPSNVAWLHDMESSLPDEIYDSACFLSLQKSGTAENAKWKPILPSNSMTQPLYIPDDISEECLKELDDEDDDNFASASDEEDLHAASFAAGLSPPHSGSRVQSPVTTLRSAISGMKPLPMLPHRLQTNLSGNAVLTQDKRQPSRSPTVLSESKSTFSIRTCSSGFISPTESKLSSTSSIYSVMDDDDDAKHELSVPAHDVYSLPADDNRSDMTLTKDKFDNPLVTKDLASVKDKRSSMLLELGYLGDFIF